MKSHLLLAAEPATFAGNTPCLCGVVLIHPEPVLMVDLCQRLAVFDLDDCAECVRMYQRDPRLLPTIMGAPGWAGRRLYLYALVEGAEKLLSAGQELQYRGDCIEGLLETVEKAGRGE